MYLNQSIDIPGRAQYQLRSLEHNKNEQARACANACGGNWVAAAGVRSLLGPDEQVIIEHQMVKTQMMSDRRSRVGARKNQRTPQSYNSSGVGPPI